jgi:hypothetical protein
MVVDLPAYIKNIYFLSCLGQKFQVYHFHIPSCCITPAPLVENDVIVVPPEWRWAWYVLQPEGKKRLDKVGRKVQILASHYGIKALPGEAFEDDNDHDIIDTLSLIGSDFDDPLVSFSFSLEIR